MQAEFHFEMYLLLQNILTMLNIRIVLLLRILQASLTAYIRNIAKKQVGHTNLKVKLESIFEPFLFLSYGCGNKLVNCVTVSSLYLVWTFQEICVGILGNMACFQDICMSISKDENLGQVYICFICAFLDSHSYGIYIVKGAKFVCNAFVHIFLSNPYWLRSVQ